MPIIWLRVALGFYAIGLLYSLLVLTRKNYALGKIAFPAMALGMVFQFVAFLESVLHAGQISLASLHNSESLLALLVMAGFVVVYVIYHTTSPGIVVFPLVFLLTFIAATGQKPFLVISPGVRGGWLFAHIALIFAGYAALFLSFGASLIYLLQERNLKSKRAGGVLALLPALETIDEISYRALLLGFPFMTLGLVAGVVVAQASYGQLDYLDPKILLSLLMWSVYLIMLYTRWNAGWRGRRAAYLATGAFAAAVVAWAANFFSNIHRFVQS
jgi:ABC-type uncharacterized transport system permease subunit